MGFMGGVEDLHPDRDNPKPTVDLAKDPLADIPAGRGVQEQLDRVKPLRERLMSGEVDGVSLNQAADAVKAAKDLAGLGYYKQSGLVWTLVCNDDETHRLLSDTEKLKPVISGLAGAYAPVVIAVIKLSREYIAFVDELGNHHGVEITGAIGTTGLIVVPQGLPPVFYDLLDAAKVVYDGKTILELLVLAAAASPNAATGLGLAAIANAYAAYLAGTPYGWALAAALGFAIDALFNEPDPNDHGHVQADRRQAGLWESFTMQGLGNQVSFLSYAGFLSAHEGGGSAVFANRPEVGDWERWRIIEHGGGVVSLRSSNGNHLVAEAGGGKQCNANRVEIGDWEKFHLEVLPDGRYALKTLLTGDYVSVQP